MNSEPMSKLRELLSLAPSWERWHTLVALVDEWPRPETRALALAYLEEHLERAWPSHWRVGSHRWSADSHGWKLARAEPRPIASLPGASEFWCPPGTFWMGAAGEAPLKANEASLTQVTLTRPFWCMTTLVTQEMWAELNPTVPWNYDISEARLPAVSLNWYEAAAFCNALSRLEGLEEAYELSGVRGEPGLGSGEFQCEVTWANPAVGGYRLLTEAEWEWACRAGARGDLYGPVEECGWFLDNALHTVQPVAQKQPNAWNLFDMLGNCWEWVYDAWQEQLPRGTEVDWVVEVPKETTAEEWLDMDFLDEEVALYMVDTRPRVNRGGNVFAERDFLRCSERDRDPSAFADDTLSFRCARTATGSP